MSYNVIHFLCYELMLSYHLKLDWVKFKMYNINPKLTTR